MGTQAKQMWTTRFPQIRMRRYPVGPGMVLIWVLGAFGIGVAVWRWIVGLGPTTNLSDGRGWGLWISFDMMAGIGLAAGAFTIAAIVYIFHLKRFYAIVRPAILTGFISYLLAAFTLLVDLGQPQRIWHLIIYWNIHSPLFEIGWCVMLYLRCWCLNSAQSFLNGLAGRCRSNSFTRSPYRSSLRASRFRQCINPPSAPC